MSKDRLGVPTSSVPRYLMSMLLSLAALNSEKLLEVTSLSLRVEFYSMIIIA